MTLIETGAKLNYRLLDAIRHKQGFAMAREPAGTSGFDGMRGHHYALVVSFKRSGEPVPSPVLFALDQDKVVFRTDAGVGKVKRIRRNPRVLAGPCNMRGKPLGPLAEGRARFLEGEEAERARLTLRRNYTRPMAVLESGLDRMPIRMSYVEVSPVKESQ
jgi:uncharacterized protein